MATRAGASALNTTLGTLVSDVQTYLGQAGGDNNEARSAVWAAIARRLRPVLGQVVQLTPGSNDDGNVPDQVAGD